MGRAGTGFGTLKLIEELQPEYVKIEPALVRGLDDNLVQQEVARSLVKVASLVGSQVVASGVESEAEVEMVRRCGIVLAQGKHLARAQPYPGPQSPEKPAPGVHKD
jgi:EAL domain-containing protein (putative c-di-GMP-specific phosphodiesterase class I)